MQRRVSNILSRLRRVADKPPTEMLPYPQIFSFNLETHILSPENPLEDPTQPLLSGSQCSVFFSVSGTLNEPPHCFAAKKYSRVPLPISWWRYGLVLWSTFIACFLNLIGHIRACLMSFSGIALRGRRWRYLTGRLGPAGRCSEFYLNE